MQNYLEKRLLRILLHILLSLLELPQRGRLAYQHWGMQSAFLLSFAFFPRAQRERDGQPPDKTLEKFSSFEVQCLYLRVRLTALKWFEIVRGKHRKRDVTTVFAYSHLNIPIDQWECAYCLKYFIILSKTRLQGIMVVVFPVQIWWIQLPWFPASAFKERIGNYGPFARSCHMVRN